MSRLFWRIMIIAGLIALGMVAIALVPHEYGPIRNPSVLLFLPPAAILIHLWRKL